MDLLFTRYASPFLMLDKVIASCRFFEFVKEMVELINQENEEKVLWDCWLHKEFERSYRDFVDAHKPVEVPTDKELETTVKRSMNTFNIKII